MTLHEGIEGACYRHAATYVRGATVLDVFPSRSSRMTILLESGAKSGTRLLSALPSLTERRRTSPQDLYSSELSDAVGEVPKCPFKHATFDVVIAFFLFKGNSDDALLLETCRRLVTPGGTFITSVANAHWKGLRPFPRGAAFTADELFGAVDVFEQVEILGQRFRQECSLAMREPRYPSRLIPIGIRDSLSRLIRNRPYYPGEYDFRFTVSVEDAPVLMAVAK